MIILFQDTEPIDPSPAPRIPRLPPDHDDDCGGQPGGLIAILFALLLVCMSAGAAYLAHRLGLFVSSSC